MQPELIFACVWGALIANGFWEAYVEGRNPWDKRKLGWKIRYGTFCLPAYHFYLWFVMWPLMLALPLVIYGWDYRLFGILVSAYVSGLVIEDFTWYLVNPVVKTREFWTRFSDYYPWIRIGRVKIVPLFYPIAVGVALLSWWYIWG